jgi:hypothetical protein
MELVTVGFQKLKLLKLQKNGKFQHVPPKHFFYYFFQGEMVILDRISDRISQLHPREDQDFSTTEVVTHLIVHLLLIDKERTKWKTYI